jgi:hypothetical protein
VKLDAMNARRWRKEHVIELANPPVFNTFFLLNEYVELIYRKKHAFKDILIREGIGEETVEDQHCIELLSILSHFCQHLLSITTDASTPPRRPPDAFGFLKASNLQFHPRSVERFVLTLSKASKRWIFTEFLT